MCPLCLQLSIPAYEIASPEWFYITSAYAMPLQVEGRFIRTMNAPSGSHIQTTVELRLVNRSVAPALRLLRLRIDESTFKGAGAFKSAHCVESFGEIGKASLLDSLQIKCGYICHSNVIIILNLLVLILKRRRVFLFAS